MRSSKILNISKQVIMIAIDNDTNKLKLGDRIKILRINQNRTLQEIADASDLSKSMISKIENKQNRSVGGGFGQNRHDTGHDDFQFTGT
jgi:predicted amino acid racemase